MFDMTTRELVGSETVASQPVASQPVAGKPVTIILVQNKSAANKRAVSQIDVHATSTSQVASQSSQPANQAAKIEKDRMNEEEQISFVMAESAKEAEVRENIKLVTEVVLDQKVDKVIEGKEDKEEKLGFLDDLLVEPNTEIDQGSQKEILKEKNDDDDKDDVLIRRNRRAPATELTDAHVHNSNVPSHSLSQFAKHLKRVVTRVTKHQNKMIQTMKKSFIHRLNVESFCVKIANSVDKEIPPLVITTTNKVLKSNLRQIDRDELYKEKLK
nr:hypothetical protein [Tanacetum cinerariifolium]